MCIYVYTRKQTWNLEIPPWKRRNIYKPSIFGFHVCFGGCILYMCVLPHPVLTTRIGTLFLRGSQQKNPNCQHPGTLGEIQRITTWKFHEITLPGVSPMFFIHEFIQICQLDPKLYTHKDSRSFTIYQVPKMILMMVDFLPRSGRQYLTSTDVQPKIRKKILSDLMVVPVISNT